MDQLSELATVERPAAVIALDLDEFGSVNKRLGHAAGDRLLVRAGEAMQSALRGDDVLGRLGGDEFAALVFTDVPELVAERLMEAVSGEDGAQCTARAGVARAPADGTGAEALLAAADVALRVSKRSGGVHVTAYDGAPLSAAADGAQAALARLCRGEGLRDRGPADRGRGHGPCPMPTRRSPASPRAAARDRCTGSPSPTSSACAPSWSSPACARP